MPRSSVHSIPNEPIRIHAYCSQPIKWKKSSCNQSDETNFVIRQWGKHFHALFPVATGFLVWFSVLTVGRVMSSKGKAFRSSPLCTSQTSLSDDISTEVESDSDQEVGDIFSQSQCLSTASRDRVKEKQSTCTKRRENLLAALSTPNDEDMEEASGTRTVSRKRSEQDVEVGEIKSLTENGKRRETSQDAIATEPANAPTGEHFVYLRSE